MYYLGVVWNSRDPAQRSTARTLIRRISDQLPDWTTALSADDLFVCYQPGSMSPADDIYPLTRNRGLVIGRLFARRSLLSGDANPTDVQIALDERISSSVAESAGEQLIEHFWGQYVAFVRNAGAAKTYVLRDPTGGVPCQVTQTEGVSLYFVRLEDCERVIRRPFTINRHYLIGYLARSSVCVPETALNEVGTLMAGERAEHGEGTVQRSFLWNPLEISRSERVEDFQEACTLMRSTVSACVHAWATPFRSMLLQLSGGLDSSIVLACLRSSPTHPRIVSRNDRSIGPDGDERRFARLAAAHAGCELIEREAVPNINLDRIRCIPRALSPYPCLYDLQKARDNVEFLREAGLEAQFTGNGGDELFLRAKPLPTSVDYAWDHGARPGLFSYALADGALSQISVWRVLQLAWHFGVRRKPWHLRNLVSSSYLPLLDPGVKDAAWQDETHCHPLYRGRSGLPPGKFCHAYMLSFGGTNGHIPDRIEGAPPMISPLRSQPVIELCLRIPTYTLTFGGRDRAVAREAFTGDVPAQILSRKSKAHGNALMTAVIGKNMDLVRQLLLDGFLVRERFVDRAKLETVLSGRINDVQTGIMEILLYLCVEAWALSWLEPKQRAVA
jgi:asparagine synthase (glutamine-hydrolysing)